MLMIKNNLQAYHTLKKRSGDFELGKLENLVPQYLRSGIEIFSQQIYASTISLDCLISKQQFIGFCNIKINGAVWSN